MASFALTAPVGLGSDDLRNYTFPIQAVMRLQPALSLPKARILARAFESTAHSCGVDWHLLVAIAYHESSLKIETFNSITMDYGLMQINEKNAMRFGLSRTKLMRDPTYSMQFACKLIKDNRERYSAKYPFWLGIYRSGTAFSKQKIVANARSYDKMIRTTAKSIGYSEVEYARTE